jgi:thiol-disulfide isomerase/thioredoxin
MHRTKIAGSTSSFPSRVALFLCTLLLIVLLAPRTHADETSLTGLWDAVVVVGDAEVPFRFEIAQTGSAAKGFFFEGDRKIGSTSGSFSDGKLALAYDFLNATLDATLTGGQLQGSYRTHYHNKREYAFRATRFSPSTSDPSNIPQVAGNWEMKMVGDDNRPVKSSHAALSWKLYLRQSGAEVTGAILRIDGDTGTLSGHWQGDKLTLSHFAGERPVLFEARLQPDGTLDILYNRQNKYLAARITEARAKGIPEFPDPSRFTSVSDPSEPFHFSFPDLNGKLVSNTDPQFKNKVVLLSIGGTWCPNCRDEAPFLVDLYKEFHAKGLEIVGLNFESSGDQVEDKPLVLAFIKEFGIPYTILLPGAIPDVKDKLPQLVNFGAYPTTIFLGRDGRVRSVHAGFASAAMGEEHVQLTAEVRNLIGNLLAENPAKSPEHTPSF